MMGAAMQERVEKIVAYAKAMADLYLSANQKLAILDPLLGKGFSEPLDSTHGAHAYNALTLSLLLDVVRDSHAFVLDRDSRAPSLENIWLIMNEAALKRALREVWSRPPAPGTFHDGGQVLSGERKRKAEDEYYVRERREREARFDGLWTEVEADLPKVLGSPLARRIRDARNKSVAHYEMRSAGGALKVFQPADAGLTWGDPSAFMDQVEPVLFNVVLLATNGSYDLTRFKAVHAEYARDFWDRLRSSGEKQGKNPGACAPG